MEECELKEEFKDLKFYELESQIDISPLEYHEDGRGWSREYKYVGKSWKYIKDDETGKEFKESILKELEKFFDKLGQPRTIEVCYRDS